MYRIVMEGTGNVYGGLMDLQGKPETAQSVQLLEKGSPARKAPGFCCCMI